jgi:hypothetical protein
MVARLVVIITNDHPDLINLAVMPVQLSSDYTPSVKYFPVVVSMIMIGVELLKGVSFFMFVPLFILVLAVPVNYFLAVSFLDGSVLTVKQWGKESRIPAAAITNMRVVTKGITKVGYQYGGRRKTIVIINRQDLFEVTPMVDVYGLLMRAKTNSEKSSAGEV